MLYLHIWAKNDKKNLREGTKSDDLRSLVEVKIKRVNFKV